MEAKEYFPNVIVALIGDNKEDTSVWGLELMLGGFHREKEVANALNALEKEGVVQTALKNTSSWTMIEYAALTEKGREQYKKLLNEPRDYVICRAIHSIVKQTPNIPVEYICNYVNGNEDDLLNNIEVQ